MRCFPDRNETIDQVLEIRKREYKNALAYFTQNIKEVSRAVLLMYSAVAKSFTEEVTIQFGVTRLHLLLIYKEVADIKLNDDELASTPIEVPADDGTVVSKPFKDCNVDELRQAIQRKRKPSSSKPIPAEVLAQVEDFHDAVVESFPEDAPVRVDARNHKGRVLISFKDIPLEQLDSLAEIIMDRVYVSREGREAAAPA